MMPLDLTDIPPWMQRASCRGVPVDLFFPLDDDWVPPEVVALCGPCPVRGDCLEFALSIGADDGIWAGIPQKRLRSIRRRRRRQHGYRAMYQQGCDCVDCTRANEEYVARQRAEAAAVAEVISKRRTDMAEARRARAAGPRGAG